MYQQQNSLLNGFNLNNVIGLASHRQKGFLLVDAVLAILIITVALVSIGGMFIQATKSNTSARYYTDAANLAQQQMEKMKQNVERTDSNAYASYPVTETAASGIYTITGTAVISSGQMVQVDVQVNWTERGISRSVSLTTLCLRNGSFSVYPTS